MCVLQLVFTFSYILVCVIAKVIDCIAVKAQFKHENLSM